MCRGRYIQQNRPPNFPSEVVLQVGQRYLFGLLGPNKSDPLNAPDESGKPSTLLRVRWPYHSQINQIQVSPTNVGDPKHRNMRRQSNDASNPSPTALQKNLVSAASSIGGYGKQRKLSWSGSMVGDNLNEAIGGL